MARFLLLGWPHMLDIVNLGHAGRPYHAAACLLVGWFGLALSACGDEGETSGDEFSVSGELGNGKFVYHCLSETDAACLADPEDPGDLVIAQGGRFDIRFEVDSGPLPQVISAVPTAIRARSGGFEALKPGFAAMLAVNGNSEVLDMVHPRVARIDQVRVRLLDDEYDQAVPAVGELELEAGQTLEFVAIPRDESNVELAGGLDYGWASGDEEVLSVRSPGEANRVILEGLEVGDTTLQVVAGEAEFELSVSVQEGPVQPPEEDAGGEPPDPEDAAAPVADAGPLQQDASPDADAGTADRDGGAQ